MDQFFNVTLVEKVNDRAYSLILPVGAPWSEAIQVAKFFAESVEKIAQDAERQAQERFKDQEPVEVLAEPIPEEA